MPPLEDRTQCKLRLLQHLPGKNGAMQVREPSVSAESALHVFSFACVIIIMGAWWHCHWDSAWGFLSCKSSCITGGCMLASYLAHASNFGGVVPFNQRSEGHPGWTLRWGYAITLPLGQQTSSGMRREHNTGFSAYYASWGRVHAGVFSPGPYL